MPTSYSPLLGLALPVTGELAGTWGDTVNNYITTYLDSSVAGTQTISGSQTAVTLSVTNGTTLTQVGSGATGSAQYNIINCTGNPASLLTITAPAASKTYLIINATSTSQSVKIVGTGPTTGVTLIAGEKALVAWNGSDFIKVATTAAAGGSNTQVQFNNNGVLAGSANLTFDGTNLTLGGGTANGVAYLNGSKVLTTGSALSFDGTNLSTGNGSFLANGTTGITYFRATTTSNYAELQSRPDISYSRLLSSAYLLDIATLANQPILFTVNSSEQARLTSTGLGIGTSSPAVKLDVVGVIRSSNGGNENYVLNDGTTRSSLQQSSNALYYNVNDNSATNGAFIWRSSNAFTERMRLDSSGNLTLASPGTFTYSSGTANGVAYLNGSKVLTTGSALTFDGTNLTQTAGTPVFTVFESASGNNNRLILTQNSGLTTYNLTYSTATTNGHVFQIGGAEQMRLTSTGLGIGTSSPATQLVVSNAGAQGVEITGSSGAIQVYNRSTAAYGTMNLYANTIYFRTGVSPAINMALDVSGNLGIGTSSPSAKLHVVGNQFRQNDATNSQGYTINTTSATTTLATLFGGSSFAIQTGGSGTNQLVLDALGNLGVGVAAPGNRIVLPRGDYLAWRNVAASTEVNAIRATTSDTMEFFVNGSVRQVIDSSGNLGLGVTPSTWTLGKAFQVNSLDGAVVWGYAGAAQFGNNFYYNGGYLYATTAAATRYVQSGGAHQWFTSTGVPSAGGPISFTQALTLDASGRLIVGTTSGPEALNVYRGAGASGYIEVSGNGNTLGSASVLYGQDSGSNGYCWNRANAPMLFGTNNTERARITSGGYFKASDTGTYDGSTGSYHELRNSASGNYAAIVTSTTSSTPYGINIGYRSASPNGTGSQFLYCEDNAAQRASIRSNGGLANYSANDVNLSDRREKTNFAPAKSYLDTICAIPVQTFNYIDQSEDDPGLTLGVVAQDVQAVAPELVMESNWGTKDDPKMRLSIYQTDLQYALMKCIQEQQAIITDLRARVAALETK